MDDLISRQAVMDCFKKWQPYMATRLWDFEQELSKLPSVVISSKNTETQGDDRWLLHFGQNMAIPSAELKTGHWIIIDDCEKFIAKCSKCGRIEDSRMISKYPYCHCGAKMVEEQEGAIRNENV